MHHLLDSQCTVVNAEESARNMVWLGKFQALDDDATEQRHQPVYQLQHSMIQQELVLS